ncbi:probable ubiquitin-like-specific protease 2B isoform X2 [Musa acuminata AAA Group]|uniref:probable ubiquitin-like-specific protease 2B isoform X2 n=1 Tax=Musa acuminata AAA Group TaxID=214697 RepID=UPI0031D89CD8
MRGSSQKDLAVFDFSEEEAAVEAAAGRFTAKLQSRLRPRMDDTVNKNQFLEAYTSGLTFKGDVTNIICVDMHERDNDTGSYAIDGPEQGLALGDEKAELDEIMSSSTKYDEHDQIFPDNFEDENLTRKDTKAVGDSVLQNPIGNKHFLDFPADGMAVDVVSEDEESWSLMSGSESSTASDTPEDEGQMECPELENCYAAMGDVFNNQMSVMIYPDYVIHGNTLYGDSQLVFSSDCIKIECSDASGSDEKFASEWAVSDIVHIDCRWSGTVTTALVKLCLRANDVTKSEKHHNVSDVLKVIFSVNDMRWLEKEHKIRNLAARYRDIWNANSGDMVWEDDSLDPSALFSRDYFTDLLCFRIADSVVDVVYPKGDPDAVSISKRDVDLLQPETFINDNIIDFYIKYLKNKIQPDQKHRFHFFNSFFFRKLADLDKDRGCVSEGRAAFLRVRKWTRKVNIFEKDYIFIPVNFNLHWSLLIICHPGEVANLEDNEIDSDKVPCILHMDSIKGSHSGLKNIIQSYMWEEWKERHPETTEDDSLKYLNLRFVSLELPQQENSFDCGLFLLHYVELFLEEAPVSFDPFKVTKFSSFLSADWFPPAEASLKRSLIWKLIYELNNPTQKINTSTCSKVHPSSSGYPEINVEQEHVELLSAHCSPAKGLVGDAVCPDAGVGNEFGHLASSSGTKCDEQTRLMIPEFLEPGENTMSSPKHGADVHQHTATSSNLLFVSCPILEHADGREHLSSSCLGKEDCQPQDGSPNAQFCMNSMNVTSANVTPWSTADEKDADTDLASECMNSNSMNIDQREQDEKMRLASPENFGYVPESPTSSPREKLDGFVKDSQENDASKAEGTDCEGSLRICTGETDCQIIDGGDIGTHAYGVSDVTDCMVMDGRGTVDGHDECIELGTQESGDGEDCQETRSEARQDDNHQETHSVDISSGDGNCKVNLPSSFEDIIVTDDVKPLDKDDVQVIGRILVRQPHKRRKVTIPEGTRMRTRSFTRESHNNGT